MAAGISKLGTALAVIFVVLLAALIAQLVFVLWRRRAFRRRIPPPESGIGDVESQSQSSSFFSVPSKELFLFLCLKTDTRLARIEPSSTPSLHNSAGSTPESPEMELVDLLKLQGGLYGPSKILFTIKEEEKEDLESVCSSVEKGPRKKTNSKRRSLEDFFEIDGDSPEISPEVVSTAADECHLDIETTPFSTPCTSPTYFTPTASPAREEGDRGVRTV
nr:Zinc finger protein [Ipomoea batatas]